MKTPCFKIEQNQVFVQFRVGGTIDTRVCRFPRAAWTVRLSELLAFARKTTAGSTEIANQSSDRKTKQPRLANKYYSSCWSASSSTAFTLPVCTETVSSFFPRKLSPRSLNTVASSKMRSSAHRSVESSLKSSRQRAGFLLLVKTMLKLPSLL